MKKNKHVSQLTKEQITTRQIVWFVAVMLLVSWPFMIIASIGYLNPKSHTFVMVAPLIAAFVAAYKTKPGKKSKIVKAVSETGIYWRFNFLKSKKFYFIAWLLPLMCALLGAGLYFALFPEHFSLEIFSQLSKAYGYETPLYIARQTALTVTIVVLMSAVPAMGEESGLRGYLMPRLLEKFGLVKALLLSACLWTVWQLPMLLLQYKPVDSFVTTASGKVAKTASGYLFGTNYVGAPFSGVVACLVYSFSCCVILWWIYCKSKSVWASSLCRGTIGAISMFALEFRNVFEVHNWLFGPSMPGLIAGLPLLGCALYLLYFRRDDMVLEES